MYLEIYESVGKVGEVWFNPYSYTYEGTLEQVAEYLETEPVFGQATEAEGTLFDVSAPVIEEVTDEGEKLRLTASKLRNRGVWRTEIIDE